MQDAIIYKPSGYLARRALEVLDLMRQGDEAGRIDDLVRRQTVAEADFARSAHGAWSKFPNHPAAEGLAALQRHTVGELSDASRFLGLSWLGELLAGHADDWLGQEAKLGARLRSSPENFFGCLFELEASRLARSWSHRTRWLWPRDPDGGDILIDEEVVGECVHAFQATQVRIPSRPAAEFGEVLWNAMVKSGRNVYVHLAVDGRLGRELPEVRNALRTAIVSGAVGFVELSVEGYAARIVDLAPLDAPIPVAEANKMLDYFGRFDFKIGAIENSVPGYTKNPRFVVIEPLGSTPAVFAAARSAVRKHDQLKGDRPAIVWVKFGQPVDATDAGLPHVLEGVTTAMVDALVSRHAHRISGVLWVFNCGVLFPASGSGRVIHDVGRDPSSDGQPQFRSIYVPNPVATLPLPDDYLILSDTWI